MRRVEIALGVGGVASFLVLMLTALVVYQRNTGHPRLLAIFFSDLMADRDQLGLANDWPRALSLGGMTGIAIALLAAFHRVSRDPNTGLVLGSLIRLLGGVASAGVFTVAAVTAAGSWPWHERLILIFGPIGVTCFALCLVAQHRARTRAPLGVAIATLGLAGWNMAQYARQALVDAPRWQHLPVVQKAAALSLCIWLLLTVMARDHTNTSNPS